MVWLGEWNPASDQHDQTILGAVDIINQLAAEKHAYEISFFQDSEHTIHCSQPEIMCAMVALMDHPWWRRAWVVQEVVAGTHATLVCGDIVMEWEDFGKAAWNIAKHMNAICCSKHWSALPADMVTLFYNFSRTLRPLHQVRERFRHNNGERLMLWELLSMFRSTSSTDHRDKVYAFLGLVTEWSKKTPLDPDYSVDASELFKRVALKILTDMGSLHLLTECVGIVSR